MYVFGELLRGYRKREGLTQQQLAEELGKSRTTVIGWEKCEYVPRSRDSIIRVAEVLFLSVDETHRLLVAANFQLEKDSNQNDDVVIEIKIHSSQIRVLQADISSATQISKDLSDTSTSEMLSKAQIKVLAKKFQLLESRKTNPHLRYYDGDISYWLEQGLSVDDLILQFGARKVVLDAADRDGTNIDHQGTLSWAATRVIPLLRRLQRE